MIVSARHEKTWYTITMLEDEAILSYRANLDFRAPSMRQTECQAPRDVASPACARSPTICARGGVLRGCRDPLGFGAPGALFGNCTTGRNW